MPRLTILNHWQGPVAISVNNGAAVTLPPGGRLERVLDGPVELHAAATGNERGFIRSGQTADGLVQDRVLVVEVPDADAAQLTFTVS
jgi:ATP-dependent exoDNAse (exonuclease V) alpha subunit